MEVGCAGGQDTIRIAERFQARLAIGIDVQREYLATAQKLHAANNTLNFLAGDARLLPFPAAKFNACFMFGVLHYLATWPQVIREIARVLKPDGFYVFQEPLKDFLSSGIIKKMFPGGSAGLFTAEDFRAALIAEGFEIVNLKPAGRLALLGVACKK